MKRTDEMLGRLLHSAARASQDAAPAAPFGFDTRVLAQWRDRRSDRETLELAEYFRWGLAVACLVMATIILFSYHDLRHDRNDELVILNSTINLALNP